jgi:hypothetical protein
LKLQLPLAHCRLEISILFIVSITGQADVELLMQEDDTIQSLMAKLCRILNFLENEKKIRFIASGNANFFIMNPFFLYSTSAGKLLEPSTKTLRDFKIKSGAYLHAVTIEQYK